MQTTSYVTVRPAAIEGRVELLFYPNASRRPSELLGRSTMNWDRAAVLRSLAGLDVHEDAVSWQGV